MNKTVIIIPSRLKALRLPNKPLQIINNKEMILHVYDAAIKSNVGEVYVATPDDEIIDLIKMHKGQVIKTNQQHDTGTDRIFEVFKNNLNSKPDIIINLQGDMPNIDPNAIIHLANYMSKKKCDIGTLACNLNIKSELNNPNIVKVLVEKKFNKDDFLKAIDFFRIGDPKNHLYHHVGIYAFTNMALLRYVTLKRSELELKRKLEQLRALENKMLIHVGYTDSSPIGVDTITDLDEVRKVMKKNEKK